MTISKKYHLLLFLVFLLFLTCDKASNSSSEQADKEGELLVKFDQTAFKDAAGIEGTTQRLLSKGTSLIDLNEISPFTTALKIGGKQHLEPWLKVKTTTNEIGWVNAANVLFEGKEEQRRKFLQERQLKALFGNELFERISAYQKEINAITNSADFVKSYQVGTSLRDTLEEVLREKWIAKKESDLTDLFWLGESLPAYIAQVSLDGRTYRLYQDYKALWDIAKATPETDDDDYIQCCIQLYPEDSIEYVFPVWTIQTGEKTGHSLLGRDHHFNTLSAISNLLSKKTPFHREITDIKDELINDSCNSDVTYWESKTLILNELDRILKHNFNVLTNSDLIALQTRRKMFENPSENKIKLNYKSGLPE